MISLVLLLFTRWWLDSLGWCCHPRPRVGKYGKDGKSRAIPGHNLTIAALGVFILWFGWFGFNPGSQLAAEGSENAIAISHVFLTTNIAACLGGIAAITVSWLKYGKPSLSLTLNGILAGFVGVTAGCDAVSPGGAAMIGLVCGTVMIFSVEFIDKVLKKMTQLVHLPYMESAVFLELC
jgi:Amt family ammonium transporter